MVGGGGVVRGGGGVELVVAESFLLCSVWIWECELVACEMFEKGVSEVWVAAILLNEVCGGSAFA